MPTWGCSSVGRAPALQAGGQEFDSPHLHHVRTKYVKLSFRRDESNAHFLVLPYPHKASLFGVPLVDGLIAQVVRAHA